MNQIVHWKKVKFDFYLGRDHALYGIPRFAAMPEFANPFSIGIEGTRDEVIVKYEVYIREQIKKNPGMIQLLKQMRGATLGCWCFPLRCHCEIVAKLIQEYFPD